MEITERGAGLDRERRNLEVESHAAAHGARGLHQVDGVPVLAEDGNVALRQEIAEIDEELQVSGEEAGGNRLAEEEIEIRIGLAGRGVEQIDRSQDMAARVAVGSHPVGFGFRYGSAELGGDGLAGFGADKVAGILDLNVGPRKIEHAAIGVIESGGQVGQELALQNQAHSASGEIIALVVEGAGINIGEDIAGVGGEITDAGEYGIGDGVGEE